MKKNILSLVGALVLSVFFIPQTSHADLSGTGTAIDPYIITTCVELQAIPSDVPNTVYYKLEGTEGAIDCSYTSTLNDNGEGGFYGFDPIDNFGGNLDGNSNTIANLYMNRPGENNVGLFMTFGSGANVHDLTFSGADITASAYAGILVGHIDNVNFTITDVSVDSSSIAGSGQTGGLVGFLYEDSGVVTGEISGGTVEADVNNNGAAGGLVGQADLYDGSTLTIDDVTVLSSLYGDDGIVGGFFGELSVQDGSTLNITDGSYGNGVAVINGSNDIGGIAGQAYMYNGYINISGTDVNLVLGGDNVPTYEVGGMFGYVEQSRGAKLRINFDSDEDSSVTVTSADGEDTETIEDFGGVIGYVYSQFWDSAGSEVNIEDTTVSGVIASDSDSIGGFVGLYESRDSSLIIEDSTSNADVYGAYYVGGLIGNADMNYASYMSLYSDYVGGEGAGVHATNSYVGGLIGEAYLIHGPQIYIDDTSVELPGEGQLSNDSDYGLGGFIGDISQRFRSVVYMYNSDANINVNTPDANSYGGLIGFSLLRYDSYISLNDTHTEGVISVDGTNNETYSLGGFIGEIDAKNSTLEISYGSYNGIDITGSGTSNGVYDVGGLVGYASADESPFNISISETENRGDLTMGAGDSFGGLIGYLSGDDENNGLVNIDDSNNSGNITADLNNGYDVGGFIGYNYSFDIDIGDSSVATDGPVTLSAYQAVGGFIGYNDMYNGNTLIIEESNTDVTRGSLDDSFSGGYYGGLVGYNYMEESTATISDSNSAFNLYDSEGSSRGEFYDVGGLIGENDTEYNSSLTIERSHSTGDIATSSNSVGGLVGYFYGYTDNGAEWNTLDITDSYSELNIPFAEYDAGGLVGDAVADDSLVKLNITDSNSSGTIGNAEDLSQIQTGYSGGLIGSVEPGEGGGESTVTITGSSSSTDVYSNSSGEAAYMGGLIGYIGEDMTTSIANSFATGDIISDGEGNSVGGLVGDQDGDLTVTASYATGNVVGYEYVGGLIGDSDGVLNIDNSYATGEATGNDSVGGLVGWTDTVTADHSYASGAVTAVGTGNVSAGGLFGLIEGTSSVSNSFATGVVSATDVEAVYIAGLIGDYEGDTTLTNNFYDQTRSGQEHCAVFDSESLDFNDAEGECEAVNTLADTGANYFFGDVTENHPFDNGDWDFETVWKTNDGALPTLRTIYQITATAGDNGNIDPSGVNSVSSGDELEFTITPDEGYEVEDVTVDGDSVGAVEEYTFSDISDNHTINATFSSTAVTYTLTTHMSGNGTGVIIVSPDDTIFNPDDVVTLTAVAAAKSTFKEWSGCSDETTTTIEVTMSADKTCTATFNKASTSGGGGGGGSVGHSSSGTTTTTTPNTPPANSPSDCTGGALFSASTGAKCGSSKTNIPGCEAGFLFSPSTGQSCAGSSQTNNTNVNNNTNNTPSSNTCSLTLNLKIGDTGTQVKCLQTILGITSDGIFGKGTKAAVIAFQKAHGLDTDGVVGPKTRQALM